MKAKFTLLIALMLTGLFQVWAQRAVKTKDLEAHIYDHDTLVFSADSSIYKVENLGENVNTDHVESGPRISPDGKTLYFFRIDTTINTKRAQEYTSKIYVSEFNPKDSTWSVAEEIGKPLNSKGANSVQSVIQDGKVLILTNEYLKNGLTKNGISMSTQKGSKWTFPEPIKIPHYHNDARYSVHITNDGKTMLLAVHNVHDKTALGEQDLYVCFLQADGKHWSNPINLGPKINTPKSEGTAFLASDGKTMYFSTNGRGGLGGYDIFKTERLDSTWTNWSKPQNMGAPFNTKDNEFYFSIPEKGDYAYLSHHYKTSDKLEHSDIVRIKLIEGPKPKLLILEGFTFNKFTNQKIDAKIIFRDSKGNIVKSPVKKQSSTITDTTTSTMTAGYYKELPIGEKYTYEVIADGYKTIKGDLDATQYGKYTEKKLDFYLELDPLLMLTMKFVDENTGKPIDIPVNVKIKQMPEKEFAQGASSVTEGFYSELPGGYDYEFEFQAHGYLFKIGKKDLRNFTERKKEEMVVKLKPLLNLTFQVENIEFDVNKATLRPASFPPLDTLVRIMKHIPEIVVEIQGHTDSDGTNAANITLSQNRAQAVVDYLVQHGINKEQFKAQGYGEEQPLVPNDSKENKQRNRRVMFKVLEVKGDHIKIQGHN